MFKKLCHVYRKKFYFSTIIKIEVTSYEEQCSKIIIKEDENLMNTFQLFPLKLTTAAHSRSADGFRAFKCFLPFDKKPNVRYKMVLKWYDELNLIILFHLIISRAE